MNIDEQHAGFDYLKKPFYTLHEAAQRWCWGGLEWEDEEKRIAKDPFCMRPAAAVNEVYHEGMTFRQAYLEDAIRNYDMPYCDETGKKEHPIARNPTPLKRVTVRHKDLREWMERYYPDQKPAFLFDKREDPVKVLQAELDDARARLDECASEIEALRENKWPWGNYETKLLRKLAGAAETFWKNYDPEDNTTAETNNRVADHLKQQGVSSRVAEIMAQILRADDLPTGPRK